MSQSTTVWQRLKTGSKSGFDQGWKALDKLGAPVNKLSNKLGSEAFWPTTLDKESDKAARILKSFCKDGFYVEEEVQLEDGLKQKQRVVKKIAEEVIRNAKGLAIFTTMRTGLWVSGAGGSGVLVAKKEDGTWSPPSGIMLHTAGLGFLVGIDIYDCVLVLNTEQAVEAFTKVRCTLGGEVSVVAGPVGIGGILETEVHKRQSPVFTYMKSRGFYAGVQIDGTVVIERMDENERFYGEELPVKDILAGKVRHPPDEVKRLMQTIKAAQGDTDYDESLIPDEPPPGDYEIDDGNMFGVPDKEDPDPYGVLALEKEGMSLREAGTQQRASWEQFSFNPAPTSPIHSIYTRSSHDGGSRSISNRNSWRNTLNSEYKAPSSLRNSTEVRSIGSAKSARSPVADSSTQTDFADDLPSLQGWRSSKRSSQQSSKGNVLPLAIPEDVVLKSKSEQQATVGAGDSAKANDETVQSNQTADTSNEERIKSNAELIESSRQHVSAKENLPEKMEPISVSTHNGYSTPPITPTVEAEGAKELHSSPQHRSDDDADMEFDDDDDDYDEDDVQIIEEPVVHSIQTMQIQTPASHAFPGAAKVVTVPKRLPPKLPPRNPNRGRGGAPIVVDDSPFIAAETLDPAVLQSSPALVNQDLSSARPSTLDSELHSSAGHEQSESLDLEDCEQLKSKSLIHDSEYAGVPKAQKLESTTLDSKLDDDVAPSQDVKKEQQSPELVAKVPGGFE